MSADTENTTNRKDRTMRPTYSSVTATLALVLAVGTGGAYAAGELGRDSVGASQIRAGAVGSGELRNGAVAVKDLSRAARRGVTPTRATIAAVVEDVITDPTSGLHITVKGERGETGPTGAAGPAGGPGITSLVAREHVVDVAPNAAVTVVAECQAGERALGGGGRLDSDGGILSASAPRADGDGWVVNITNATSLPTTARAFAVCGKVGA